jgi:serine acetyltransferase
MGVDSELLKRLGNWEFKTVVVERVPLKIHHLVPTRWGWMVSYPDGLVLDTETDIGAFTYIQAQAGVTIERGVQIGSHCAIYSVNTIDGTAGPVFIREGACIGSHSVVFPGVEIGRYAKCGAFSLIKEDVAAGVLFIGRKVV